MDFLYLIFNAWILRTTVNTTTWQQWFFAIYDNFTVTSFVFIFVWNDSIFSFHRYVSFIILDRTYVKFIRQTSFIKQKRRSTLFELYWDKSIIISSVEFSPRLTLFQNIKKKYIVAVIFRNLINFSSKQCKYYTGYWIFETVRQKIVLLQIHISEMEMIWWKI